MFKDPFPQPRRPKKSNTSSDKIGGDYLSELKSAPGSRIPRGRIYVLVGLFALLLLASGLLKSWVSTEESKKKTEEPSVVFGTNLRTRITGVPSLNMSLAERISDRGPEARARWPHEAMSYLLHETQYEPAVREYARNLIPLHAGSAEQIVKDSRFWRFKYVSFRGKLESLREENYDETYGESKSGVIGQIKRGRVTIPGEQPVHVTFVTDSLMDYQDRNQIRPEIVAISDGWVRIRGIFVKNFLDRDADGTETPSLLVAATRVERDFERVAVNTLADVGFEVIVDDPSLGNTDEGRDILHKNFPRPMFRLLKYAEARAGEYGRELREKENLTPDEIDTSEMFEAVIGNPGKYRGKYFGGYGIIGQVGFTYGATDIRPNDAGVEGYMECYIGTDRIKLVRALVPEPLLVGHDWKKNERVRWAGYFYKSLGYPARNGTRRLAPFVVLTELVQILPEERDVATELYVAFGALGGIALLVWIILRDDKTKKDFRRRRRPLKVDA